VETERRTTMRIDTQRPFNAYRAVAEAVEAATSPFRWVVVAWAGG